MDRAPLAIVAVCALEAAFRVLSRHVPMDALAWTLVARTVQASVILAIAPGSCGVKAGSIAREAAVGLAVSAAFGAAVLACDLASRAVVPGGVLGHVLVRQGLDRPLLYVVTVCLAGPFAEELFFRGLLYGLARKRMGAAACTAATALLFASMHGVPSVVQLAGGVMFALLYEWRRTVWPGFVLHASANLGLWLVPYVWASV
ncbi:MAG TPA: CPBP family intramembrane metalloprotease [Deltaproteobacteria bacterium]|nr:CPBP family intramembrane metalloprotease [Deltaproteobacteria bacterium]